MARIIKRADPKATPDQDGLTIGTGASVPVTGGHVQGWILSSAESLTTTTPPRGGTTEGGGAFMHACRRPNTVTRYYKVQS
jgi:hypothetical protein